MTFLGRGFCPCTEIPIEVGAGRGQVCADQRKPMNSFGSTGNHSPEFWPEGIRNSLGRARRSYTHSLYFCSPHPCQWWMSPFPPLSVSIPAGLLTSWEHQCLEKAWAEWEHGACARWGEWHAQSPGTYSQNKSDSFFARYMTQQTPTPAPMSVAEHTFSGRSLFLAILSFQNTVAKMC